MFDVLVELSGMTIVPEIIQPCRILEVAPTGSRGGSHRPYGVALCPAWHLDPARLDHPALIPLVMTQPLMGRDPAHWTDEVTHDGPTHVVGMILSALGRSPHGFIFSIPKRPHTIGEWWFSYIYYSPQPFLSDVGCYILPP